MLQAPHLLDVPGALAEAQRVRRQKVQRDTEPFRRHFPLRPSRPIHAVRNYSSFKRIHRDICLSIATESDSSSRSIGPLLRQAFRASQQLISVSQDGL